MKGQPPALAAPWTTSAPRQRPEGRMSRRAHSGDFGSRRGRRPRPRWAGGVVTWKALPLAKPRRHERAEARGQSLSHADVEESIMAPLSIASEPASTCRLRTEDGGPAGRTGNRFKNPGRGRRPSATAATPRSGITPPWNRENSSRRGRIETLAVTPDDMRASTVAPACSGEQFHPSVHVDGPRSR